MTEPRWTQIGWCWLCPIWIRDTPDEFTIEARHWLLTPLLFLCLRFEEARIFVSSLIWDDYEPSWCFTVTGDLHHEDEP